MSLLAIHGRAGEVAEPDADEAKEKRQRNIGERGRPFVVQRQIERLQAERRKRRVATEDADHHELSGERTHVDHTSAARLLPPQVTPAEIADPVATELRSFSPKDIADIVAALNP